MKKYILLIMAIPLFGICHAADKFTSVPSATGSSSLNISKVMDNPAILSDTDSAKILMGFVPAKYGISGLNDASALLASPVSENLYMSAGVQGIFFSLYNEYEISLSAAYVMTDDFSLGMRIGYARLDIPSINNYDAVTAALGGSLEVSDGFRFAFSFDNLFNSTFSGSDRYIPRRGLIGFSATITEDWNADLSLVTDIAQNTGVALASSAEISEMLKIRLAHLTNPAMTDLGMTLTISPLFALTANIGYHHFLGWNNCFGMELVF